MISAPERFGLRERRPGVRLAFASVGVWWALFSLPIAAARCASRAQESSRARRRGGGLLRVAS
jgi:hypothetical protein